MWSRAWATVGRRLSHPSTAVNRESASHFGDYSLNESVTGSHLLLSRSRKTRSQATTENVCGRHLVLFLDETVLESFSPKARSSPHTSRTYPCRMISSAVAIWSSCPLPDEEGRAVTRCHFEVECFVPRGRLILGCLFSILLPYFRILACLACPVYFGFISASAIMMVRHKSIPDPSYMYMASVTMNWTFSYTWSR